MLTELILAFGTLFPIVNPFSTSFVFNSIAKKESRKSRAEMARTASITAAVILLVFLGLGKVILSFFSVTIYAFRVAGGLYLLKVAFDMLGKTLRDAPEHYTESVKDMAIIPLAIPLLSGPGAITSVLVMADIFDLWVVAMAIVLVSLLSWLILIKAHWLDKVLGRTGTNVVERILGLLVLVIAVQFLFNGLAGWLAEIGIVG